MLAFGMPGLPELLIVAGLFVLLFGATKLPSLMRNMGRSVNEFKQGLRDEPTDIRSEDDKESRKLEDHERVT